MNECIKEFIQRINDASVDDVRIMEVCGTHTQAAARYGICDLLPHGIKLLSGPGCPVCVTAEGYIDAAIQLLEQNDIILATFGDMIKVKGTAGSLFEQKAECKRVEVVYSPEDAIKLALRNKHKEVVFAAVGFETTAPLIAVTVKSAMKQRISNLSFLSSLKRMEPVIRFILEKGSSRINGMLCPGHIAAIVGAGSFRFITDEYGIPAVVCGFYAADILEGIASLAEQISGKRAVEFANLYKRCVSEKGNIAARNIMDEVFEISDTAWRGIGNIENSALVLSSRYKIFDAASKFNINIKLISNASGCECSDILLGKKTPHMCIRFGTSCTPESPAGPCMVSSEGSCAVYYRYRGGGKCGQ